MQLHANCIESITAHFFRFKRFMMYDSRIVHVSESSPALPDKLALVINVGRSTFLAARHVSPHEAVFSGL